MSRRGECSVRWGWFLTSNLSEVGIKSYDIGIYLGGMTLRLAPILVFTRVWNYQTGFVLKNSGKFTSFTWFRTSFSPSTGDLGGIPPFWRSTQLTSSPNHINMPRQGEKPLEAVPFMMRISGSVRFLDQGTSNSLLFDGFILLQDLWRNLQASSVTFQKHIWWMNKSHQIKKRST